MAAWNTRTGFQLQAAGAAAMALLLFLWLQYEWGGETATRWFSNIAQLGVAAAAGMACWWRSRNDETMDRAGWIFMAAACWAWAGGQLVWSHYELIRGIEAPGISIADAGFLGFLLLAVVGIYRFAHVEPHRLARVRALLDAAIGSTALLFVVWYFFLADAVAEGATSVLEWTVNLGYPIGDTLLLSLALFAIARSATRARAGLALLCLGLVAMAVADFGFLFLTLSEDYGTGHLIDVAWVMAFQLIGLAAMTPPAAVGPPTPLHEGFVASSPAIPFLLAVTTAIVAQVQQGGLSPFLFWNAMTFIVLVVVRQSLLVVDNMLLKRQAEQNVTKLQDEKTLRAQLLNNVTHDLLSPMSPVRLQVNLLQNKLGPLNDRQANALEVVERNVEHVVRLGQDLKELANLDSGHLSIKPETVDLTAVAREVATAYQEEAGERRLTLTVEAPDELAIEADPTRLRQVLINLLTNALKFTPTGGQVTLRITHASPLRVEVTDTGRGLTPEERARLFRPFSQVHAREEIKERGTGLGLFISKGIVEGHGGRMGVRSEGHGKGSTFWFTLPKPGVGGRIEELV